MGSEVWVHLLLFSGRNKYIVFFGHYLGGKGASVSSFREEVIG
jgi:hypothetical protein